EGGIGRNERRPVRRWPGRRRLEARIRTTRAGPPDRRESAADDRSHREDAGANGGVAARPRGGRAAGSGAPAAPRGAAPALRPAPFARDARASRAASQLGGRDAFGGAATRPRAARGAAGGAASPDRAEPRAHAPGRARTADE